ncbi:hypothetical protein ON010_g18391 [Phytophthora cinnamomi]|nr:hypothetical protein ON010_g18391 [Phytophthora cinnamomi]
MRPIQEDFASSLAANHRLADAAFGVSCVTARHKLGATAHTEATTRGKENDIMRIEHGTADQADATKAALTFEEVKARRRITHRPNLIVRKRPR